jgi:hypothetical protein
MISMWSVLLVAELLSLGQLAGTSVLVHNLGTAGLELSVNNLDLILAYVA